MKATYKSKQCGYDKRDRRKRCWYYETFELGRIADWEAGEAGIELVSHKIPETSKRLLGEFPLF